MELHFLHRVLQDDKKAAAHCTTALRLGAVQIVPFVFCPIVHDVALLCIAIETGKTAALWSSFVLLASSTSS